VPACLFAWLRDQGAPEQALELAVVEIDGRGIDRSVAAADVPAGDLVLRIPEHLVVTLGRVFEDETVAELLTTDKLSELACLALYLMCEGLPAVVGAASCRPCMAGCESLQQPHHC